MRQFSEAHLAALSVLAVTAGASVWLPRRHPGPWLTHWARLLALLILAGWAGEYVVDVARGIWTVKYDLPLQLTDAVSAVSIVALLSRRQLFVELVYFWSLTATLQAVITPDLAQTFPSIFYFTYFTYHIGAIVAACLLVFGCRLYPRRGALWRVFALTLLYTAMVGVGDILTGGNYMYLRAKPVHNSLLNLLGPWPWYIVATVALALVLLLVLQWLADRLARLDSLTPAPWGGG